MRIYLDVWQYKTTSLWFGLIKITKQKHYLGDNELNIEIKTKRNIHKACFKTNIGAIISTG
jgi:hypothetical protein